MFSNNKSVIVADSVRSRLFSEFTEELRACSCVLDSYVMFQHFGYTFLYNFNLFFFLNSQNEIRACEVFF
jgi:hypothetical protein